MTTGRQPSPPSPAADGRTPGQVGVDAEEEAAERRTGGLLDLRGARRGWFLLGCLTLAALVGLAVWFGISAVRGVPVATEAGFANATDRTIDVRFDIARDPARAVTCVLVAQEMSHQVVGRAEVTLPPAATSPTRQVVTVKTAGPAVAGSVDRCWYTDEGPGKP